jgi:hypothetical protein
MPTTSPYSSLPNKLVCMWGIPDHALLQRLSCLQPG